LAEAVALRRLSCPVTAPPYTISHTKKYNLSSSTTVTLKGPGSNFKVKFESAKDPADLEKGPCC
jgi:hypothetical protein